MEFKSQKELFNHVFETRGPFSELSGKPLLNRNHNQWHWQFLHVLPKGSYPAYKLKSENILLGLPDEHQNQETFEVFQQKKEELRRKYYKEIYGKVFDNE